MFNQLKSLKLVLFTSFVLLVVMSVLAMANTPTSKMTVFPSKRMFGLKGQAKRSLHSSSLEMNFEGIDFPQLPATISPFISGEELFQALRRDPFHLRNTYTLGASEIELRTNKRSINKLKRNVDYAPIRHNVGRVEGNTMKIYSVEGTALSGIVNLDRELNVWDVKCDPTDDSITIDFSDHARTASRFIPGTRFIISEKWNCFRGQEDRAENPATTNVVLTREIIAHEGNMMRVRFQTRSMSPAELFMEAEIGVNSRGVTPISRKVLWGLSDAWNSVKKAGAAVGGAVNNAYQTVKAALPDPTYEGSASYTTPMLNINCDSSGTPINNNIPIYKAESLEVACEDVILIEGQYQIDHFKDLACNSWW